MKDYRLYKLNLAPSLISRVDSRMQSQKKQAIKAVGR